MSKDKQSSDAQQTGPGLGNGLPKSISPTPAPKGYVPLGNSAPGKEKRGKQGQ